MKTTFDLNKFSKKIRLSSTKIIFCIIMGLIMIIKTVLAQTNAQKLQIQASTNVSVLNQLATSWYNSSVQEKQLAEQWATNNGYPIKGISNGVFFEIQKLDEYSGMPVYYITNNLNSAKTISTNKVWSGGGVGLNLSGTGMIIGEWDSPIVNLSQYPVFSTEFGTRLIQIDTSKNTADNYFHPLHVAGTMIATGNNPNVRGMANQAKVRLYDSKYDYSEMAIEAGDSGLLFSNHSYSERYLGWAFQGGAWYWYGTIALSSVEDYNFGFYNIASKRWDAIAYNAPKYLIVKSAANERGERQTSGTSHSHWDIDSSKWDNGFTDTHPKDGGTLGYDCLDPLAVAKNILTVGAVQDIPNGWTDSADVNMTSFSSWGPTDDGRIKPDIVANGECVYSTWNGYNWGFVYPCPENTSTGTGMDYYSISGTSQAAPSVTGSLALLQQHYSNLNSDTFMLAATLKALVIHTADEAGPNVGPDYMFGWGLMNTSKAAQLINKNTLLKNNIHELTLHGGRVYTAEFTYDANFSGVPYIKITMAWTDPPGTPVTPQLNPRTPMLVHDLDMVMYTTGQNWGYLPYILDPANPSAAASHSHNKRDNVEQIYMTSPVQGKKYTLVIRKDTLLNNDTLSQPFSLIIEGANVDFVGGHDGPEFITFTETNTYPFPPSQPALEITDTTCNSVRLYFYTPGATSYKIYYGTGSNSTGGTGLSQGNSPITITSGNSLLLTGLLNGTNYNFKVKGVNAEGEGAFSDVVPFQTLTASAGSDISVCNDQGVQLGGNPATASGGFGNYTYLWSPNQFFISTNTESDPIVQPPHDITYTVTVTDSKGCQHTDDKFINVSTLSYINANAGSDREVCSSLITNGLILTASGNNEWAYSWYTPDNTLAGTGKSITVNPTTSITYTLIVRNVCGFTDYDEISITIVNDPIADGGADICYNGCGFAHLEAGSYNSAYSYSWSGPGIGTTGWCGTTLPGEDYPLGSSNGPEVCVAAFSPNVVYTNNHRTYELGVWFNTSTGQKCVAWDYVDVSKSSTCPEGADISECPIKRRKGGGSDYAYMDYAAKKVETLSNGTFSFMGNLTVPEGTILNIVNAKVFMDDKSRVTVEPNAVLNLISSQVTACFGLLSNIEVLARKERDNSYSRGKLVMENSEIRNAEVGLINVKMENGVIDYTTAGGILEFRGKNIIETRRNGIIKVGPSGDRKLPEPPIVNIEFIISNSGPSTVFCDPIIVRVPPVDIYIENIYEQKITGNTFDGNNDVAIWVEKSSGIHIQGNVFSENLHTGVTLIESKDFTLRENIFKVKDTGIHTEKTQTETGSRISENTFVNNRIAIDLSDDDHSKTEISCNKMTYTEYGIRSINTLLMNQGTKSMGAGNTFTSLEAVPRLNNQLYHNGTGATMTYYYDPSQPVTLLTDANLRANAVKAQRDNVCLTRTARIADVTRASDNQAELADKNISFELMPNPSEGIFTVTHTLEKENKALFEITDLRGKKMLSIPANQIENNRQLNLTLLPKGMYLYRVREGNRVIDNGRIVVVY